jgi:hypothetical protein
MASTAGKAGSKKKTGKCPFLTRKKDGRWLKLACTLPEACPNTRCLANPGYQEPVPDGGE